MAPGAVFTMFQKEECLKNDPFAPSKDSHDYASVMPQMPYGRHLERRIKSAIIL